MPLRTFIFICYRREDSSGQAGRLYDHLTERFGEDQIFMDIDRIEPGQDFLRHESPLAPREKATTVSWPFRNR